MYSRMQNFISIIMLGLVILSHYEVQGALKDIRTFSFDSQNQTQNSDINITMEAYGQRSIILTLTLSYPEQRYGLNLTTFGDLRGTKKNFTSLSIGSTNKYYSLEVAKAIQEGACLKIQSRDYICQYILESDDQSIIFFTHLVDGVVMDTAKMLGMNPVSNLMNRSTTISQTKNQEFQTLLSTSLGIIFSDDQDTAVPIRTVSWEKDINTRSVALPKTSPLAMYYECSTYNRSTKMNTNQTSFSLNLDRSTFNLDKEDRCNVIMIMIDSLGNSLYVIPFKNQLEIHTQGAGTIIKALLIIVVLIGVSSFLLWFVTERLGGNNGNKRYGENPSPDTNMTTFLSGVDNALKI